MMGGFNLRKDNPKDKLNFQKKFGISNKFSSILLAVMFFVNCALISGSLYSCNNEKRNMKSDTDKGNYIKAKVEKKDMTSKIKLIGSAMAKTVNSLSFEISGKLLFIAEEGDKIIKGEKLAEVDNSDAIDRLAEIETDVKNAESLMRIAQINYQSALDANHVAIQLAETDSKKSQEIMTNALIALENAKISANLAYESANNALKSTIVISDLNVVSAENALNEAKRILKTAKNDLSMTPEDIAKYEYDVKSAEENLKLAKAQQKLSIDTAESCKETSEVQTNYTTDSAENLYKQSLLDQSTTYWSNVSNLENARAQIELAQENIKQAELKVKNIKIKLKEAKKSLQNFILIAPYNCIITNAYVSEGNKIKADQEIIKIVDFDSIIMKINIPEIDRTKVKESMNVNMSFDAYPDKIASGKIYKIAKISKANKAGIFFEAFIKFTDLKDIDILSIYGLNSYVEIITAKKDNVLVVPNDFIYKDNEEEFVYKMNDENKVEKVLVDIGISDLNYTEILYGLKEDDTVVIVDK